MNSGTVSKKGGFIIYESAPGEVDPELQDEDGLEDDIDDTDILGEDEELEDDEDEVEIDDVEIEDD